MKNPNALTLLLFAALLFSADTLFADESAEMATGPAGAVTSSAEPEMMTLRRTVVCASGLIYWIGVWVQAKRVRRKIGRTPNLRPRGVRECLIWLGWTLAVSGWIAQPLILSGDTAANSIFGFFPGFNHPAVLATGILLIILGYAGTHWCYSSMGAAWRIGIDTEGTSKLVQTGPYRGMRHPIYSFQMVMLIGAALLLPTPVSVAIILVHFTCASIKANDEEKHLMGIYGSEYLDYMGRSGRFTPKLG